VRITTKMKFSLLHRMYARNFQPLRRVGIE